MRIGLAMAGGLGALALAAGAATAQDADDWEFQQDAAQDITVAAVRYDGGVMIVVQCKAGALTAVIAGLPRGTEPLKLEATRADGRHDTQDWASAGAAGAFRSENAGRDVRFMRGGGLYSVRTLAGATPALATTFDLPTQSANLDRALTACGWAASDDRDLLTRAGDSVSLIDPADTDEGSRRPRRSSSHDISGQGRRRTPSAPPSAPPVIPAERQLSCVIRAAHLAECRADHPGATPSPMLARLEGLPIFATDPAAEEGRIWYSSRPDTLAVLSQLIQARRR